MDYSLVTDPIEFAREVLAQTRHCPLDAQYGSVLRVLLYYVWRGAFESRAALVTDQVEAHIGLLGLSVYKAFVPIVQMIRLGYPADTLVLLRALMERIALLGYLHENRHLVANYASGKPGLQKQAMRWAKEQQLENWMMVYGLLSKVAHSGIEGSAGHLLEENPIGDAFRLDLTPSPERGAAMSSELLAGIVYALAAVDPILCQIIQYKSLSAFPSDTDASTYLRRSDLVEFQDFLQRFRDKHAPRG